MNQSILLSLSKREELITRIRLKLLVLVQDSEFITICPASPDNNTGEVPYFSIQSSLIIFMILEKQYVSGIAIYASVLRFG